MEKRGGVDNTFVYVQCIFLNGGLNEVASWWCVPLPTLTCTDQWHKKKSDLWRVTGSRSFLDTNVDSPSRMVSKGKTLNALPDATDKSCQSHILWTSPLAFNYSLDQVSDLYEWLSTGDMEK